MFTGIVEGTGKLQAVRRSGKAAYLIIDGGKLAKKLRVSDSIAVNGTCLTIVRRRGSHFEVQAVEETMKKTNLGTLEPNDRVNLELPLRAFDRLGGHIVLGHIDGVGRV
ncbi:MAG: riboflavin synthase, partial [Bacteroidota bacterium]